MKYRLIIPMVLFVCGNGFFARCGPMDAPGEPSPKPQAATILTAPNRAAQSPPLVRAARQQVGKTTVYDAEYVSLAYPGGDVPIERGVCSDVIVRAFREALGMDLQKLIHEDMRAAFSDYPANWGLQRPDRNIDHRRVPNLERYFERKGWTLPVSQDGRDYEPGDLVTCTVPRNRPHIVIVSDKCSEAGIPLVIHNIGQGAREEDSLFTYPITGHYRVKKESPDRRPREGRTGGPPGGQNPQG